ncbi:MAG: hypothetical protein WCH11_03895 [Bdellovibrio sp.]
MRFLASLAMVFSFTFGFALVRSQDSLEKLQADVIFRQAEQMQMGLQQLVEDMKNRSQELQKTPQDHAFFEKFFRKSRISQLHLVNPKGELKLSVLRSPEGVDIYKPAPGPKPPQLEAPQFELSYRSLAQPISRAGAPGASLVTAASRGDSWVQVLPLGEEYLQQLQTFTGWEWLIPDLRISTLKGVDYFDFEKHASESSLRLLGKRYQVFPLQWSLGEHSKRVFVLVPLDLLKTAQRDLAKHLATAMVLGLFLSIMAILLLKKEAF